MKSNIVLIASIASLSLSATLPNQGMEALNSSKSWKLDDVNRVLNQLMKTNDQLSAGTLVQDERFNLNRFHDCEPNYGGGIYSLTRALSHFKMETLLVKLAHAPIVTHDYINFWKFQPYLVQLFLSYDYKNSENIEKMEEWALRILRKIRKDRTIFNTNIIRMLMKNPIFPAPRPGRALTYSWYDAIESFIRDGDKKTLRLVTIYWHQFRERVNITADHGEKLVAKFNDMTLRSNGILLTLSLNRDFYFRILGMKNLNAPAIVNLPKSFRSSYKDKADFDTYVARIRQDFSANEHIMFACHCLENNCLNIEECLEYTFSAPNGEVLSEMTYYDPPAMLTGSQLSRIFMKWQSPSHPMHWLLMSKRPYDIGLQDLHLNYKPVLLVIMDLLSEGLYLLNDFLFEYVLKPFWMDRTFSFLDQLSKACQFRNELRNLLKQFPPCLHRHFLRAPNLLKNADELYYILKVTTDESSVHSFIRLFLLFGSEDVLEQVMQFALVDELKPVIEFIRPMLKLRYYGKPHSMLAS